MGGKYGMEEREDGNHLTFHASRLRKSDEIAQIANQEPEQFSWRD